MADRQEVIFVEGGSRDNNWSEIQAVVRDYTGPFQLKCMQQDGRGKGDAVRKAFASATGDCLMILDADISVPPEELGAFYDTFSSGKGEFINGSRMVYMMDRRAMRFLNLLGNKTFGWGVYLSALAAVPRYIVRYESAQPPRLRTHRREPGVLRRL